MSTAVVLGGGMIGAVIAADLARDMEVIVVDVDEAQLAGASARARRREVSVRTARADLSTAKGIHKAVESADVVVGALASSLGFGSLEAVIDARKPYCDISFMPERAMDLDGAASANGVTAVVDCGVAPGMSNILAAHAAAMLDPCDSIAIYVGGLPRERRWPFEFKAAFAPGDVIEEYTRPARLVEHGDVVTREALSEPELIDLPGVGTLEAFNTDGLRSLIETLEVPFMKEKTLRYPGHAGLMRVFRETGLFGREPLRIDGAVVRPLDVLAALMFPKWRYGEGEQDLTVMRVLAEGRQGPERRRVVWDLLDTYADGTSSMARATGYPAAIVARMLAEGKLDAPGVHPPEMLGRNPALVEHILDELGRRGVRYEARNERA